MANRAVVPKVLSVLVWLAGAGVVGAVLVGDFDPDGRRTFLATAGRGSAAIRPLVPENRVELAPGGVAKVLAEPVYLDVALPQRYDTLTLEADISNPSVTYLQAGLQVGPGPWQYRLEPLQHRQLDALPWPRLTEDGLTLWQKYPRYSSVADFLANEGREQRIATFNYDLRRTFTIPGYVEPAGKLVLNRSFRGAHTLALYVSTSTLSLRLKVQDINRTEGSDPLAIYVVDAAGRRRHSDLLPDDGVTDNHSGASAPRYVEVELQNLQPGAYLVELRCNDDVFFRQVETVHHKLAFREKLYLVDSPEYQDGFLDLRYGPTTLYGDGRQYSFRTAHPAGYQTVYLNGLPAATLAERHREYPASSTSPHSTVRIPVNDVVVSTDGWLAFSRDQFFNPEVYSVGEFPSLTAFDFIIAQYVPGNADGWRTVTATFNLAEATLSGGRVRLLLSGLDPTRGGGELLVGRVKVTLTKPALNVATAPHLLRRWLSSWRLKLH